MSIKVDTMLFELASLRRTKLGGDSYIEKLDEEYRSTPQYKEYVAAKDAQRQIDDQISSLENDIREVALSEFAENQVKDLGGVQVKIFTIMEYDDQAATDYCLSHNHASLLKLDKRKFEKVAKELQPDFVTIKEEPRAQIASDLSDYLNP